MQITRPAQRDLTGLARQIQASAARGSQTLTRKEPKERLADFELPPAVAKVEDLYPWCPWAHRFVNVAAVLGSLCPWQVTYDGQPIRSPLANAVASMIQPVTGTTKSMRKHSLTLQRKVGQHGVILTETPDGIRFRVASSTALKKSKIDPETMFGFQTRRNAKPGKWGWEEYPINRLKRHVISDPDFVADPTTELTAALGPMELYAGVLETALATVDQRKAISLLLHLKLDPEQLTQYGTFDPIGQPGDRTGHENPEDQAIEDLYRKMREATEKGGPARALPFPFLWQGDVDLKTLGDVISTDIIDALQGIAQRGIDALPISAIWLLEGTGAANHWGDAEQRRELHTQTVYPELDVNDEMFTDFAFRPLMKELVRSTGNLDGLEPERLALKSDRSAIEIKPDNQAQILELYRAGIVNRKTVLAAFHLNRSDLLDIGNFSELDHFNNTNGATPNLPPSTNDPDRPQIPEQAVLAAANGVLELLN